MTGSQTFFSISFNYKHVSVSYSPLKLVFGKSREYCFVIVGKTTWVLYLPEKKGKKIQEILWAIFKKNFTLSLDIQFLLLFVYYLNIYLLSCYTPYSACWIFMKLSTLKWGKKRKLWALRPQKPLRLIRDGDIGGSRILYLTSTRYTVTTRMILH